MAKQRRKACTDVGRKGIRNVKESWMEEERSKVAKRTKMEKKNKKNKKKK